MGERVLELALELGLGRGWGQEAEALAGWVVEGVTWTKVGDGGAQPVEAVWMEPVGERRSVVFQWQVVQLAVRLYPKLRDPQGGFPPGPTSSSRISNG